jgi:hypothetical protein
MSVPWMRLTEWKSCPRNEKRQNIVLRGFPIEPDASDDFSKEKQIKRPEVAGVDFPWRRILADVSGG